jgi:hypothetical protein
VCVQAAARLDHKNGTLNLGDKGFERDTRRWQLTNLAKGLQVLLDHMAYACYTAICVSATLHVSSLTTICYLCDSYYYGLLCVAQVSLDLMSRDNEQRRAIKLQVRLLFGDALRIAQS